uniref:Ig-like domain-containing protein n=1 Tax=Oncorhynchus tshawytscha TaxID=74940 RepID=A0AAZ3NW48_ONCTS
ALCSQFTPDNIQYERMDGDVTMQCGSLDSDASVTWKVNGTDVKAHHREEGSRLILMEVDLSNNGLYSCFQNPNGERRDQINLRIGSNSNDHHFPLSFSAHGQHNQESLEVTRDVVHKNRCHVLFPEVFSSYPYRVNVTAVNALGKASTTITFEEINIVKPDPPERVVATPIPSNVRRLEYFLRYRPLIRDQWQHVELTDSTAHTITDAYAGKEYIIQVAAKDMEIGTWSDWSVAVHATPWMDKPQQIPSTTEQEPLLGTYPNPDPNRSPPPTSKNRSSVRTPTLTQTLTQTDPLHHRARTAPRYVPQP